jgi:hypothetical protein
MLQIINHIHRRVVRGSYHLLFLGVRKLHMSPQPKKQEEYQEEYSEQETQCLGYPRRNRRPERQ